MRGIYIIRNLVNEKYYLGSSQNIDKRFQTHKRDLKNNKHHNQHLQNSYDKYGLEAFSFEILLDCPSGDLFEIEQQYLNNLDYNLCYNISKGACGGDNLSKNPNKEDIIKRRTETNIINNSLLTKNELSKKYGKPGQQNGMFGKTHSNESRHKMSVGLKGKSGYNKGLTFEEYHGEEKAKQLKSKMSENASKKVGELNPFFGRQHSEETKQKLREINAGKKNYKQCIPFTIDDKYYLSLGDASKELDIPLVTIRWRIKSNNPKFSNYNYTNEICDCVLEKPCSQNHVSHPAIKAPIAV